MSSLLLTPRVKYAIEVAADLFREQYRDLSGLPYVVHLYGVCHITQQLTDDEDVHIAALLHDVLEDISTDIYSAERMESEFGARVRELVETVSHDEHKYGKRESRERYLQQIANGSLEACLVSGADLLYNATDIVDWYAKEPELTREEFGGERAEHREWFYAERFKVLSGRLGSDHALVQALQPVMDKLHQVHAEIM